MPPCLCLPLPRDLLTRVAAFVFLCLGPSRTCSVACVLFCAFISTILLGSLPMMLIVFVSCLLFLLVLSSFGRGTDTDSTVSCAIFCMFLVLVSCGVVTDATVASSACSHGSCKLVLSSSLFSHGPSLGTYVSEPFCEVQNHVFECLL